MSFAFVGGGYLAEVLALILNSCCYLFKCVQIQGWMAGLKYTEVLLCWVHANLIC